jgi:hypothetical protein
MSDEESSDEEYTYGAEADSDKRFPVHDCCEFGDVEALKVRMQQQTLRSVAGLGSTEVPP